MNSNYCSNCGYKLDEGADVCLNCGKMVHKNKGVLNIPEGSKSKVVAALFAFFLGGLGVHNFYLGYIGKGIAQLLLTLVGWLFIFGPIISSIWAFIEFICLLTGAISVDNNGNKLV